MSVLIIAEHNNTALNGGVLNTIKAATLLKDDAIDVLIMGKDCAAVAQTAAKVPGVRKVLHADAPLYEHALPEDMASLIVGLAKNYQYILAPASTSGKNTMPRVAALLDVAQVSEITAVISGDTFVRPIYAGNAFATVQSKDPIKVITVRATVFDAVPADGGNATVESVAAGADTGLTKFVSQELAKSDRPDLTAAKVVIAGGRGLSSAEQFKAILEPLATKLNAAIGATRAVVDAGFVSNDLQIGQTGKVIAPELYIGIGISGAIQHVAGIADSKVIVAINKDEEAPIFQIADYGLVADLFTAVPELTAELG
ncbi:MAG: electron transfer flavoprotein subunit alpha [Beggiatoa sp. IS2]|nr:MAG: electron transfer flavoprotein subunit alpha [Beggiatoa sp. IS2]